MTVTLLQVRLIADNAAYHHHLRCGIVGYKRVAAGRSIYASCVRVSPRSADL